MIRKLAYLLLLMIIPLNVYADKITISCPSNVDSGKEFTCSILGETESIITSLSAEITLSNNVSFVSFIPDKVWQGDGVNGKIDLYTDEDLNNTFNIGILKLKLNDSNMVNVSARAVNYYNDDEEITVDPFTVVINKNEDVPSNNQENNSANANANTSTNTNTNVSSNDITSVYLVDLIINNYDIGFIREEQEYTLKINDENSLDITPILEDETSTFDIVGNDNLKNGSIIRINITSTDDNIGTYLINIIKDEETTVDYSSYRLIFYIVIAILIIINIVRIISTKIRKKGRNGV